MELNNRGSHKEVAKTVSPGFRVYLANLAEHKHTKFRSDVSVNIVWIVLDNKNG